MNLTDITSKTENTNECTINAVWPVKARLTPAIEATFLNNSSTNLNKAGLATI